MEIIVLKRFLNCKVPLGKLLEERMKKGSILRRLNVLTINIAEAVSSKYIAEMLSITG